LKNIKPLQKYEAYSKEKGELLFAMPGKGGKKYKKGRCPKGGGSHVLVVETDGHL